MSFSEQIYIRAEECPQRGPYSYPQLRRLYDRDLIPHDALYWQEGMEEWQPIAELCGAPMDQRRRRLRLRRLMLALAVICAAACAAFLAPTLREAWKEMDTNEREYTREAAYWRARSFVREELRRSSHASVTFSRFDPAAVELAGGTGATVTLNGAVFGPEGGSTQTAWRVSLRFNPMGKTWHLAGQ